ncbi:O-antigen ligase family protein [Streptomyces griseoaurantiacus]|uniref:O-antigen ligase n=1 Tax=Streptomyces griseoaurantiacus TaxID=68213 RepID=A0A1G7DIG4_9ACTN|nr:O-antigen ligase family protein [Streptomyces jietaisiensis]SDE50575.1 O-antigen ligase [Streptomyces jietaisiensis]
MGTAEDGARAAGRAAGGTAVRERRGSADAWGVTVLGACAGWALLTAAGRDARPEGVLLAVLAVAAGYATGRIAGAVLPVAAPAVGALAGLWLALGVPDATAGPRLDAPLGHAGATAALLALSAGAACCAAWAASAPLPRLALRLLAAGAAVAAVVQGSVAGCLACAGVLLCSLAAARMPHRGLALAGPAAAVAAAAALAWAVAEDALPEGLAASAEGQLGAYRILLWRDAVGLAGHDLLLGTGPGRFGELSPTAAGTLASDGRPHSAALQQAAEQGLVGVALLAAACVWVLYALWRSPRGTPVVLSAGVALAAVGVLASAGNALSFTAVTVGVGALAGVATARPLGGDGREGGAGGEGGAGAPGREDR